MNDSELDTLLRDEGTRWRTERPAAPELDAALGLVVPSRRRLPWLAIAAAVLVIVLVAAVPVVRALTRHDARPAGIDATVKAALVRAAQQQVDGCGGGSYRATAVATTQGAVDHLLGGAGAQASAEVWALAVVKTVGVFACTHSCPYRRPVDACTSHVPAFVLTVTRDAYAEILFATSAASTDLSTLGPVIQIHP